MLGSGRGNIVERYQWVYQRAKSAPIISIRRQIQQRGLSIPEKELQFPTLRIPTEWSPIM